MPSTLWCPRTEVLETVGTERVTGRRHGEEGGYPTASPPWQGSPLHKEGDGHHNGDSRVQCPKTLFHTYP